MGLFNKLETFALVNGHCDFSHVDKQLSFDEKYILFKKCQAILKEMDLIGYKHRDPLYQEKRDRLESIIIEQLREYPELLTMSYNSDGIGGHYYKNLKHYKLIGVEAAKEGFRKIAEFATQDESARRMQDGTGTNVGMVCATKGWEDLAIESLQDPIVSVQTDQWGYNLGMHCASRRMRRATDIALDNHKASVQQDAEGRNIGMILASKSNPTPDDIKLVLKACQNSESRRQTNVNRENIFEIFKKSFDSRLQHEQLVQFVNDYNEMVARINIVDEYAEEFIAELNK